MCFLKPLNSRTFVKAAIGKPVQILNPWQWLMAWLVGQILGKNKQKNGYLLLYYLYYFWPNFIIWIFSLLYTVFSFYALLVCFFNVTSASCILPCVVLVDFCFPIWVHDPCCGMWLLRVVQSSSGLYTRSLSRDSLLFRANFESPLKVYLSENSTHCLWDYEVNYCGQWNINYFKTSGKHLVLFPLLILGSVFPSRVFHHGYLLISM